MKRDDPRIAAGLRVRCVRHTAWPKCIGKVGTIEGGVFGPQRDEYGEVEDVLVHFDHESRNVSTFCDPRDLVALDDEQPAAPKRERKVIT